MAADGNEPSDLSSAAPGSVYSGAGQSFRNKYLARLWIEDINKFA